MKEVGAEDFPLMKYLLLVRPFHVWVLISQNDPNKTGVNMHSLQRKKLGFRGLSNLSQVTQPGNNREGLNPPHVPVK